MSQTSIHFKDQGYTSPDFLTNLFKRPLYSSYSSLSSLEPDQPLLKSSDNRLNIQIKETELCRFSSQKFTSPLAFRSSKENKYFKSDQGINEQRISSKKYKIFFKTLMYGKIGDQQMNLMWQKLQRSLGNPFDFDHLIEQIKSQRQTEIEIETVNKLQQEKNKRKEKVLSKSQNHNFVRKGLFKSLRKKDDLKNAEIDGSMRGAIKKEVTEMKNIIILGQRFYRKR